MPWAVAGAAIGAAGSLGAGAMQSSAVGAASKAQQQMAQLQRDDMRTWRDTGGDAERQSANLLGLYGQPAADAAMSTFQHSPGYAFQMEQGLRGIDAGAAARGMLRSGATLKAEEAWGQGLANQDFSNYYNRLMDLSKTGASAAAGQGSTTNASIQGAGQAGAEQASIYGNIASGLSNTTNKLFSDPNFQNTLKGLGSSGSGEQGVWD